MGLLVPAVDPQGELVGVLLTLPHDAGLQVLGGTFGHDVDTTVHGQDDGQRDVEGAQRGEERVEGLLSDLALTVVLQRDEHIIPARSLQQEHHKTTGTTKTRECARSEVKTLKFSIAMVPGKESEWHCILDYVQK